MSHRPQPGQNLPPNLVMPTNVSRTPPPSPKRAPPSSPTKRRRFLKESEDNAGELSIEQYIYRTDPYRSTSVPFPFPTPLFFEPEDGPILQRLQNDPAIRDTIRSTLGKHDIKPQMITFDKQSKPGYPAGGEIEVTVIRISIDVRNHSPTDAWSAARRDVKALLIERGFGDIEVELIDPQRCYLPSLFPVSPKNPLVTAYEAKRGEILEIVEDALKDAWTSISLFRVGRTSLSTQHAIVIMVRPLTKHDWLVLRWRIESLTNTQGVFQAKLAVEFMPGYWGNLPPSRSPTPGEEEIGGKSFESQFNSDPMMGTSIGVLGEGGGGTLGGFFRLECHGRNHTGFLTNSHVVQPAGSTPEAVQTEYNNYYGCDYSAPKDHPARSQVRYFAAKDVKATRHAAEKRLRITVASIARIERDIQDRRAMDLPFNNLLQQKGQYQLTVGRLENMKAVLETMPRILGQVLCASGRAVTKSNRVLDWAFVETPAHIQSLFDARRGNLLPQRNAFRGYDPEEYDCEQTYDPPEPEAFIQGFSKIEKGQWYFKVGRTTGLTTGVCNGTQTTFRLQGEPVHVLHDKAGMVQRTVKLDQDTVNEYVIINAKHGFRSAYQQQPFCRSGDSGSLLIDAQGYIAGLVFGSLTGLCGPFDAECQYVEAGLATDIRDILASIAARTTKWDSNGRLIGAPGTLSLA